MPDDIENNSDAIQGKPSLTTVDIAKVAWTQQAPGAWAWWHAACGADLVPVTVPWATVDARHSRLDPAQLGKSPGMPNGNGSWHGVDHTAHRTGEADAISYGRAACNVGLTGRRWFAFDIDFEGATPGDRALQLAGSIKAVLQLHLGGGMLRSRAGTARCAVVYRRDQGEDLHSVSWKMHDTATDELLGKVELIAALRQLVVAGVHPSGALLECRLDGHSEPVEQGDPAVLSRLPVVSVAAVEAVFEALQAVLDRQGVRLGGTGSVGGGAGAGARAAIGARALPPDRFALLGEALHAIPNDGSGGFDYDQFIRRLAAVKAACGGDEDFYRAVFLPWALQFPGNHDRRDAIRAKWDSVHDAALGADWLEREARRHGWQGILVDDYAELPPTHEAVSAPAPVAEVVSLAGAQADRARADRAERGAAAGKQPDPDDATLAQAFDKHPLGRPYLQLDGQWWRWSAGIWQGGPGIAAVLQGDVQTFLQNVVHLQRVEHAKVSSVSRAFAGVRMLTLQARLRLARVELPAPQAELLDADPLLFNMQSGVVDLGAGTVRAHDVTRDLFAMQARCGLDPLAQCPVFWQLLRSSFGDERRAELFVECLAAALVGQPRHKSLVWVWGPTNTGKTRIHRLLHRVFGSYFQVAEGGIFARGRAQPAQHRSDKIAVHRRRLVVLNEIEREDLDPEKIKAATGGGDIDFARQAHAALGHEIEHGTYIAFSNNPPDRTLADRAASDRILSIEMRPDIVERIDADVLDAQLAGEAPAVLALLVSTWRCTGGRITVPPEIEAERQAQLDEDKPARRWFKAVLLFTGRADDVVAVRDIAVAVRPLVEREHEHAMQIGGLDEAAYLQWYQRQRWTRDALESLGAEKWYVGRGDEKRVAYRGVRLLGKSEKWLS